MVLTCSYQWSAVRACHYKVLRSIEMGLVKWGDSLEPFKRPFFIPTALLPPPDTISKSKKPQPKLTSPRPLFSATTYVTLGHGMVTVPTLLAPNNTFVSCVNAQTIKRSAAPSAGTPSLQGFHILLHATDYMILHLLLSLFPSSTGPPPSHVLHNHRPWHARFQSSPTPPPCLFPCIPNYSLRPVPMLSPCVFQFLRL